MANPNLAAPTAVYAANTFVALTSTSETQLISNASTSNKVYLVDSVLVSNVDGASAADVTVTVYNADTNTGVACGSPARCACRPTLRWCPFSKMSVCR